MIKEGLFEKFPCDELYGLHNAPDLNHGEIAILPGPAMAGADFFDIAITGYGAHGAMPNYAKDPIVIAMSLGQALQTIVSRNINPHEPAVLSITQIHAGSAYNVIPGEAGIVKSYGKLDDVGAPFAIGFDVTVPVKTTAPAPSVSTRRSAFLAAMAAMMEESTPPERPRITRDWPTFVRMSAT